jgi:hypothetical protein
MAALAGDETPQKKTLPPASSGGTRPQVQRTFYLVFVKE